uniref:Uncharacterized protein n=1 Tax=Arundo donax TaxID=35708 RepID=A0A0A9FKQ2_ARUDO
MLYVTTSGFTPLFNISLIKDNPSSVLPFLQ